MPHVAGVDDPIAEELFNSFMSDLVPHFPFIYFSPGTSAQDVNRNQPTLFLAILAATATGVYPELGRTLAAQLEKVLIQRVFVSGKKSLELVQALLISAIWYHPPENFANLKFTQYAHMAANMALDIRIGMGVPVDATLGEDPEIFPAGTIPTSSSLVSRRTYIACYLLCSRSVWNLLSFNNFS
jgi:hypothetical protein